MSDQSVVLVLGDSLSAAYGIAPNEGWVSLLEREMDSNVPEWQVVNGSVSGFTTLDGLNSIDELLHAHRPKIVILELGANDGLRGYPVESIRENLMVLIQRAEAMGAKVILAGMQLPQNYGPRYLEQFKNLYPDLAAEKGLGLVPFLLDEVAIDSSKMQDDGIHPNALGQPQIKDNVWDVLEPYLRETDVLADQE